MSRAGTSCRRWRGALVEMLWDELDPRRREELQAHLAGCAGCTTELEELRSTLRQVEAAQPPRPKAGEIDLWHSIAPRLDGSRPARRRLVLAYPAAAALAAALMLLGSGLGLWWGSRAPGASVHQGEATNVAGHGMLPAAAPDRDSASVAYARFLERATPLLLAVANREVGGGELASFDPATERRLAERLAGEAAELTTRLAIEGSDREARLIADLGAVFLQMANLPPRQYRSGIAVVQAAIEQRALLFQLTAESLRRPRAETG
ncbi:MAG: zf-HC2 domain-containing protein [Holophagales bacterium]|nr:zf-HC2 domain-containing protein [Holophagales bacterium]